MCGEKSYVGVSTLSPLGSPPRVRGKVLYSSISAERARITPACAGKSSGCSPCLCQFWDHPRVCGEKSYWVSGINAMKGSPPRVRGKDTNHRVQLSAGGITPACAGKSLLPCIRIPADRDHPRVYGEKVLAYIAVWNWQGSPPRVRGKVYNQMGQKVPDRITPACAGKSLTGKVNTLHL